METTMSEPVDVIEVDGKSYKVYRQEPNIGDLACTQKMAGRPRSVFIYDEDCAAASDYVTFYLCKENER